MILTKQKDDRDCSKTRKGKGSMAASLIGKRLAQEVTVENLETFNSTKKKVFAMIPFDRISGSLM